MKFAAGILGLIALFALRPALNDWFRGSVVSTVTANAASCLTLLGSTTSEQEGSTFIIGSIKNKCDHKVGDVTIVFKFDQELGPTHSSRDGIAYAYSRNVTPGETRKFKTAFPIPKKSTFRFDTINAF